MKKTLFGLLLILSTSQLHAKVENCEVNPEDLEILLQNNEVKLVFKNPIIVEPQIKGDFISPTNHDQFFYMKEAAVKNRSFKEFIIGSMELTNEGKIVSFIGNENSAIAFVNMNMSYEVLKNSFEFTLVCKPKGMSIKSL